MNFAKTLSRDEMKNITGGGCSDIGDQCLFCSTPNGLEGWYRDSPPGDADGACNGIYPGYGGDVSGQVLPCNSTFIQAPSQSFDLHCS